MSPLAWVAVAGVIGIGLYEVIKEPSSARTLEYMNGEDLVVVRLPGQSFEFPMLDVRIRLPDDWTYLSTTDPALETGPTFVNSKSQSIVKLRATWGVQWNGDPADLIRQELGDTVIQWIKPIGNQHTVVAEMVDTPKQAFEISLRWSDQTFQRIGRLVCGEIELIVVAISFTSDGEDPIGEFFRAARAAAAD